MAGALLLVVAMVVVLPALLFAAGAGWSALLGQSLGAEADRRAVVGRAPPGPAAG